MNALLLVIIIVILSFLFSYKETIVGSVDMRGGGVVGDLKGQCLKRGAHIIQEGRSGSKLLEQIDPERYMYKEWDLDNCKQPFHCCDDSSNIKTQSYVVPQNKKDTCAYAFTSPSRTSPLNKAGSFSNLDGLYNLKVNANAAAFTDKDIFDNAETDLVETPCGPVSTFNAYASPMALPNPLVERPEVITNIVDNSIPPHLMTQVELVRRAPYGIPEPQPVPVNALPIESPCNFTSEYTNLASFFRRNTNIFFKDEQQFPICQTAWPTKTDCLNNIMYSTMLSPKEKFVVNKI